jgi:hypothetical protein
VDRQTLERARRPTSIPNHSWRPARSQVIGLRSISTESRAEFVSLGLSPSWREELNRGDRDARSPSLSPCQGSGKDCVLPYIHLLYIKRLDRQIVLRFSMAEVRISESGKVLR